MKDKKDKYSNVKEFNSSVIKGIVMNEKPVNHKFNDVEKAIYARLRQFGCSFWIIRFEPWCHPLNKVLNCYALMTDGFVVAKFEHTMSKRGIPVFKLKEYNDRRFINIPIKIGRELTWGELRDIMAKAKIKGLSDPAESPYCQAAKKYISQHYGDK